MVKNREFADKFQDLILNSRIDSFKMLAQYLLLEFLNDDDKKIIFHIDCRIVSNIDSLNKLVNNLSKYDKDVFEIAYFVAVNLQTVIAISFTNEKNLVLSFSNGINLSFILIDDWGEPLNISVLDKNNQYLDGCKFFNDGTITY